MAIVGSRRYSESVQQQQLKQQLCWCLPSFLCLRCSPVAARQRHAHLFFCKKPARLGFLCAQGRQSFQATGTSSLHYSLNSREQPTSLKSASIFEAVLPSHRLCSLYGLATMYQEGSSFMLVFQYTTLDSTKQATACRHSRASATAALSQTSQLLQHDQIGERNGCPFVQI